MTKFLNEIPTIAINATFFAEVAEYHDGTRFDVFGYINCSQMRLYTLSKSDSTKYAKLGLTLAGPFDCGYELKVSALERFFGH
jgi:hypothetical protein